MKQYIYRLLITIIILNLISCANNIKDHKISKKKGSNKALIQKRNFKKKLSKLSPSDSSYFESQELFNNFQEKEDIKINLQDPEINNKETELVDYSALFDHDEIIDENGNELLSGKEGEIVIKGPNITAGYENNPQANTESFINGWFRTGDLGSLDSDGYLTITGRSKEIINRGGEKISPREVDEILLNHPDLKKYKITFEIIKYVCTLNTDETELCKYICAVKNKRNKEIFNKMLNYKKNNT